MRLAAIVGSILSRSRFITFWLLQHAVSDVSWKVSTPKGSNGLGTLSFRGEQFIGTGMNIQMLNRPMKMQEPAMIFDKHKFTECTYHCLHQDGALYTSIWIYLYRYIYLYPNLYVLFVYINIRSKNTAIFLLPFLCPLCPSICQPTLPFAGRLGRTISKLLGLGFAHKRWWFLQETTSGGTVQIFCYHLTSRYFLFDFFF